MSVREGRLIDRTKMPWTAPATDSSSSPRLRQPDAGARCLSRDR